MKKRVHITDDDPGVQDIFKMIFENAGYAVTIFQSGPHLLSSTEPDPDLYLIDKQLSGMDGLDICRKLKRDDRTKNIPVIIVSATPDLGAMAYQAGANDFIEKPFRKIELLNMVAKHLEETVDLKR